MEDRDGVETIDECVSCLNQQVIDLLSLRDVITKLSTNWELLKLSLREKGLLREKESSDDGGPHGGAAQEVTGRESATNNQAQSEAVGSIVGGIHSVTVGTEEAVVDSTVTGERPVEGHGCQASDSQVNSIGFIGPVIPHGGSLQTTCGGDDRGQSLDDCVDTPVDETNVQQNGNGNMETSEVATVQASGLQMS